jgi:cytochrome P450
VTYGHSAPTAPKRLPLLGHAVPFLSDPLGFLASMRDVGDVVQVYLLARPIHVVVGPELVHELLTRHARTCVRGSMHETIRAHFGAGLLAIDGEEHYSHRRALQPHFRLSAVAGYASDMSRVAEDWSMRWQPGQVLDLVKEMHGLALDMVTAALFGMRLQDGTARAFLTAFPHMVKGLMVQALAPSAMLTRVPLPVNRRFRNSVNTLMAAVDEIIHIGDRGMLETLRAGFPRDVVRAEIITMLVAGTETAAVTLTWLYHELSRAPDILTRVVAELDAELGDEEGITDEHLDRLSYTRRVVMEVLRRHTPNSFLMRQAMSPIRLGEYAVPAGAELMFSLTTLHRHPEIFAEPLKFDPDRWLMDHAPTGGKLRNMPFGAGKHKCIGDEFSWRQMAVTISAVLRRWRLEPVVGAKVREIAWTTVQPHGVRVRIRPRVGP